MKIYLAGENHNGWLNHSFFSFNRLSSFFYVSDKEVLSIHRFKRYMLDSGAFTFMGGNGGRVNWEKYVDEYANFIKEHNIDLFIEMDIDSVVGLKKVEKYRKRIEQVTGKQPIPVLHRSRGKDYWVSILSDYKYVGVSATNKVLRSSGSSRASLEKILPWFIALANKNNAKVHGLGYTPTRQNFPFYSVDSTAWLFGNRGGFLYKFNGKIMTKIQKPPGTRLKSREVAIHNFTEWVKYSNYMERSCIK